ncbi:14324_t:CDS:10 [Funneliformis mosseae]|uniref:DNA (cytosine-5-)-methyltransferase n=1 Tax=Funneliformis mosseae TaxID=27381 RepID=A0A9N9D972_FUNMO|nr:14324_t:CDS:10 [Funneliformis mosseae]
MRGDTENEATFSSNLPRHSENPNIPETGGETSHAAVLRNQRILHQVNDSDVERYPFDQSHSLRTDPDNEQQMSINNENMINNSFEYDPKLPKLNKFSVSVKPRINGSNVFIEVPTLKKVRTAYKDRNEVAERFTEEQCINFLMIDSTANDTMSDDDTEYFGIKDFVVYDENSELTDFWIEYDFRSSEFYWNGVLVDGDKSISCIGAHYKKFTIEGYGVNHSEVTIWFESYVRENLWYKVISTLPEFTQLWNKFVWKVYLTKYVLDWIHMNPSVLFKDLESHFYNWIHNLRSGDPFYEKWISELNPRTQDFRLLVVNNMYLIWHEAYFLGSDYSEKPFFQDEWSPGRYSTNGKFNSKSPEQTIVTPTVFRWFDDIFPTLLDVIADYSSEHKEFSKHEFKELKHKGTATFRGLISENEKTYHQAQFDDIIINIGDCCEIYNDVYMESNIRWICYITAIIKDKSGGFIKFVWLYSRNDTLLQNLDKDLNPNKSKELFFTLHCECAKKWPLNSIKRKVLVHFGESKVPKSSNNDNEFFCKYAYLPMETEGSFITFHEVMTFPNEKNGLCCGCGDSDDQFAIFKRKYEIDDCILLQPLEGDNEELYTVCRIESMNEEKKYVTLRRFYRLTEVSPERYGMAKNELLFSDYLFNFDKFRDVVRSCHVEFLPPGEEKSVNLLHRGTGEHFYFSRIYFRITKAIKDLDLNMMEYFSKTFPDWFYKVEPCTKLKCLDLFCGGGSLGRGFEDAGFVECKWAIDTNESAMKTYMHNSKQGDVVLINESVNKILANVMRNENNQNLPKKGEVDIILAGSPCQGFSRINKHQDSDRSIANNSLVASVASFVDFYRPRFLLLENVATIQRKSGCLLEIGYQIKVGLISAIQQGCAQERNRVFLWAAAHGEVLPNHPPVSHLYSKSFRSYRTLFYLGNGTSLKGLSNASVASFKMSTVGEITYDLPKLDTGIYWYPTYPDHVATLNSYQTKEILRRIPVYPPGSDYYSAREKEKIPDRFCKAEYDSKREKHNGGERYRFCQRIEKNDVFSTICTSMRCNGFHPRIVHFEEPRVISVREAARAQGFLENDILCGTIADQYKVIGNSVPRNIAFALGLQLGRALTDHEHEHLPKNNYILWNDY